ncbi:serine hydrolase domain-containing protein [Winogradskyella rapida]|uniref:Serine hydrolase domain-containing protein n=1 Tax=Winogradskyella rapida TaxID=549701 RepID=A0ABW3KXI4_9FLAO
MKYIKNTFKILGLLLILLVATLYITDTDYLLKAVRTIYMNGHKTAYLEDYQKFDNQNIAAPSNVQPWPKHQDYNIATETKTLTALHESSGSIAYVIIKNDSVWFENYYDGFTEDSKSNSFSMAKSYVSGLMQKAVQDGYIKSLDQPVCDFLPEFCEGLAAKMTVGDLSSMSSGTNWDEAYYSPLSITTRAYFDDDLAKVINGLEMETEPGQSFKYASGDTQMLAMVIEKASGKKLYDYFEESFWKPLGSENETLWQVDSDDHDLVKAYCCIASNAKDFARYGKLFKNHGKWNGKQILDSTFVAKSVKPRFENGKMYGYGWWLAERNNKSIFYMRGHLGQYVIVIPEDDVIIVRLGHTVAKAKGDAHSPDFYTFIDEAYAMMNP